MRNWEMYVRERLALAELARAREQRIVRELAAQLEDFYREALSRGLSEAEADDYAREQVRDWSIFAAAIRKADQEHVPGPVEQWIDKAEEASRRKRGRWMVFADLIQDARYALRQLRKSPGFTAVAVLTLALGIGANTAIFSLTHAALVQPLPYPDADRLALLWENNRARHNDRNPISPANYLDWKERSTVFEHLSAFHYANRTLSGDAMATRVSGVAVTGEFFALVGVQPLLGRTFSAAEIAEDGRRVVLSEAFWKRRFGADPELVGKTVMLDDEPYLVTGIMPARESYPPRVDLWLPLVFTEKDRQARGRYLIAIGRLKPGVSFQQAQGELDLIAAQLEAEHPVYNTDFRVSLVPMREGFSGTLRGRLLFLLGATGFVLLIACANVASLVLGRVTSRERELAVRSALGAQRFRLVRQLLTESLLLAVLGGLAAIAVAALTIDLVAALLPGGIRAITQVGVNLPVLGFTLAVSWLAGVLFGAAPALQQSRVDLQPSLKEGGRGLIGGRQRLRSLLVVGEVALSLVLLIGSGLLIRSLIHLQGVDPGFHPRNVLAFNVTLPNGVGGEQSERARAQAAFFQQLIERMETLPGVVSAGGVNFLPIETHAAGTYVYLADKPRPPAGQQLVADIVAVAGDYFRTMGIPLRRGRFFDRRDVPGAPAVIIVNETLARQFWPGEDPIGKRLIMPWNGVFEGEVVGVVGDVLQNSLAGRPRPTVYWAEPQFTYGFMTLVVRSTRDPTRLTPTLQGLVAELKPNVPAYDFQTLEQVLADSVAGPRLIIQLLTLFAGVALVLAVVGLYGVISYWVGQRRHEIGIRMALGAEPASIFRMVVGQGMVLTLAGLAIGLAGAAGLTRYLESLLFGLEATDPLTFAGVAGLFCVVAFLACYVPARRATRVDPMQALRYE